VTFLQSDLLAAVDGADFDAVVSNPPYIADGEVLEPQVSNYEPHSALYAGPTGLEVYERLIPQARKVLKPQGWLMLEIGFGQQAALLEALLHDWSAVSFVRRPAGNPASGSGAQRTDWLIMERYEELWLR
jgi:release factor glutamine methyltransferase